MKDHVVLRELLCRAVVSLSLIHQASIHVVLFYPAQGVAAGNSFRWIAIIGCQGGNAHIHNIGPVRLAEIWLNWLKNTVLAELL